MNKFTYVLTYILFFLAITIRAGTTDTFIPAFINDTMAVPASGNEVIRPATNTTLTQVLEPPEQLQQGQVLLRRRFSADEYGLYLGIMNPKAYRELSAFKPADELSIKDFLNRKLYEAANPVMDIDNVYFDGDLIYVQNMAKVYYFDGDWQVIDMLNELPCRLNITSEPVGASVYVNEEFKGTTPVYLGATYKPTAVVRVDLKGYFIAEEFIYLTPGVLVEKHFSLKKKPVFDDGSDIDISAYTAENTESVIEMKQRIETVRESVRKIVRDSTGAVQKFINDYPPLKPKDQFETTEEYMKRKKEYEARFDAEKLDLSSKFMEEHKRMLDIIPQMETYLEKIKEREYTKYFDGSILKLSEYNADSGYFPVSMKVNEKGFVFTFRGKLIIPRDEAREFYNKGTSSGKVILAYKNWHISLNRPRRQGLERENDSTKTAHSVKENFYVYLSDFKLKFKDVDYDLEGEGVFPDFIRNSLEYHDFLSEVDEKREKERIRLMARGDISITSKPRKISVTINDSTVGTTPYRDQLRPGMYTIALREYGFHDISDSIIVVKDSLVERSYELVRMKSYLDSVAQVRTIRRRNFQRVRRVGFFLMTAASASAAYFFDRKAKESHDQYMSVKSGGDFDTPWVSYEKNMERRKVCITISGVGLGLFVLSIPF